MMLSNSLAYSVWVGASVHHFKNSQPASRQALLDRIMAPLDTLRTERSIVPSGLSVPGMGSISHSPRISGADTVRLLYRL